MVTIILGCIIAGVAIMFILANTILEFFRMVESITNKESEECMTLTHYETRRTNR